jgi:hypothetical protein
MYSVNAIVYVILNKTSRTRSNQGGIGLLVVTLLKFIFALGSPARGYPPSSEQLSLRRQCTSLCSLLALRCVPEPFPVELQCPRMHLCYTRCTARSFLIIAAFQQSATSKYFLPKMPFLALFDARAQHPRERINVESHVELTFLSY